MATTAAILAGGRSERMGSDKALLSVDGIPLLVRMARIAQEVTPRVLVVGRARPFDWPFPGVSFVPDAMPGLGPLGGLMTALRAAGDDTVLALACDMPLLTADALRWLLNAGTTHALADGVVTVNRSQVEPLFALYTAACLPLVESRIGENRCSLHGLIEAGAFGRIQAPPEIAATLVNMNTPADFAALIS